MEERNWLQQPPEDIAKSIIIEAAELLEHFQWTVYRASKPTTVSEKRQEILDELADVFVYSIEMAIVLDCDIDRIVSDKLARAAKKYPASEILKLGAKRYDEIKRKFRTGETK